MIIKITGFTKDEHQNRISRAEGRINQHLKEGLDPNLQDRVVFLCIEDVRTLRVKKQLLVQVKTEHPQADEITRAIQGIIETDIPGYEVTTSLKQ